MTALETQPADPQTPADESPATNRRWLRQFAKATGWALLGFVLFCTTAWSILAVYYSDLAGRSPRGFMAALVAFVAVACLWFLRPRRYGVLACFGLFGIVLIWFFSLKPSNERDWAPDATAITHVDISGDRLTVHNVRNIDYRSETDFTPRWEDRTYDLAKLRAVDVMLVHWGSPEIAHVMVSFVFDGEEYLAVSIEARKQKSESYSAVEGFFRQFELIYVFADERDVVRLRTNYRHEDVYVYRTSVSPAEARAALLSYVGKANALAAKPEFYNALTSNCANNVVNNARAGHLPAQMSWRILLSGHAAEQMYDNHRIDTSLPYPELRTRSLVNERAIKADQDPNFSAAIRVGLPTPAVSGIAIEKAIPAVDGPRS